MRKSNQNIVSNKDDLLEPPKINTSFESIEEIFDYYRKYGMQSGFGVSKRSSTKTEGITTYITIGCSRYEKSNISSQNALNPHPITKTQCKVRLIAKRLEDNKWIVTSFLDEHNHVLSPEKSRNYRCNRKLTVIAKRKLELNDVVGIKMNKNFNVLMVEAGGHKNLPFLKQIQYIYTNSKFKEFQHELTSIMYCKSSLLDSVDLNHYYEVSELKKYGENDGQMRRINFNVSFLEKEDDEIELQCICKLFEFCEILCRHILLIMIENNIFLIPSKYILQ
ncbi:Protein FAR-RED ELONGATED HYPOCOTYL 3 [Platanthera zijinensis]|uniref:Protein FAR-RED ELONGATED HYPOCOTYL 3 n=1 Tax=Platanthera zijinensis TaxID=2320716 RepID=A0AAP0B0R9_9ASPA